MNIEGIGILTYDNKYLMFKPADMMLLRIRKGGLTVGEASVKGTLVGLTAGLSIWSLSESNPSFEEMLGLTTLLTVGGATVGALSGAIAEITNTKLKIKVNRDVVKYQNQYHQLNKYINLIAAADSLN